MRILLSIALCLLSLASAFGQTTDDIKKQINKIKKSSQYIYAEATAPTEKDARTYAEERLFDEVNKWVATQKKMNGSANLVVNNRKELWTPLSIPRGTNMFRYFVYVRKKDIIATDNAVVIENKNRATVEEKLQLVLPESISLLAGITDYYAIADKVKQMEAEGKIKGYNRYASLDDPDKYSLIVFNKEAKVVAILTPGPDRLNVKTNQPDGVSNYRGCGAIGVEAK